MIGLVRTMRPHQWVKNLFFVPAPLVFAQALTDVHKATRTAVAVLLFSLVASAVYVMNDLVEQVNQSQAKADQMVEALALGEPVEVHQVMIALNEASNALNLTLQVRNKALEAYQEVMRLQI